MLITPDQKGDHAERACDNYRPEQNQMITMSASDSFTRSTTSTVPLNNNINLVEDSPPDDDGTGHDSNKRLLSTNEESSDHCSNSTTSSLTDIKNCNIQVTRHPQRSMQRLKATFPPHINLSNSKKTSPSSVRKALFISDDVVDDFSQPLSPMSASPTRSPISFPAQQFQQCQQQDNNGKYELMSGRLHLIRHTGNVSPSDSPSSPSRGPLKCFPFQVSSSFSSPTSSPPPPLLPSSPTLSSKRKTPVYMRVYKCNMDHFALVSRDSSQSSKHVYLNLRHSRVLPGEFLGRFIVAGNCDSGSLMEFETSDLSALEKWLDALQNGSPPCSPIRKTNTGGGGGGSGGGVGVRNGSSGSACSTPIPKSPALPTLTETDEED